MTLDIEGMTTTFQDRHMPVKPSVVDGARFRKPLFQRNGRNVNARSGGAHIADQNPDIDLEHLPTDVRREVEAQRGKVHVERSGKGSVAIFTVVDDQGKKRTIIDL